MDRKRRKGKFLFVLFFPLMWLLLIAIVMWLWNAILPSLFQVQTITYWQAAGLFLLCRILFGGFHFRGKSYGSRGFGDSRWSEMREKWMNMNEEERSRFKNRMRNRCWPSSDGDVKDKDNPVQD